MSAAELLAHASEIEPYEISLLTPRQLPYHLHIHRLQRPNPWLFCPCVHYCQNIGRTKNASNQDHPANCRALIGPKTKPRSAGNRPYSRHFEPCGAQQ